MMIITLGTVRAVSEELEDEENKTKQKVLRTNLCIIMIQM